MGYAGNPPGVKTSGASPSDKRVQTIVAGSGITLSNVGSQTTIATSVVSGSTTLDGAYDYGGAGAGRQITADAGSVEITSSANTPLKISAVGGAIEKFRIDNGTDAKLVLESGNNGNQLLTSGPVQSTLEASAAGKVVDPTAVDLQYAAGSVNSCAQGINSAILGGTNNAISAVGSDTETANTGSSIRASNAAIIAGSGNAIFSNQVPHPANSAIIAGGQSNVVKNDPVNPTLIANSVEQSAILGGINNEVINASTSAIISGDSNDVVGQLHSVVVGGDTNKIDSVTSVPTSVGALHANAIVAGRSNNINTRLTASRLPADYATQLGENNVILGGYANLIDEQARNCLVIGTSGKASTTGVNNDDSVLYIGGSSGGRTNENALAFVGVSSRTGGAVDAGDGFADGTFTGGGADFAEMFEWNDGNPNDEDRVGLFVKISSNGTLPNGKIEVGGDGFIVGPVSAKPGLLANGGGLNWNSKYLKDDFGRYELDSNGERQLNPNFDENLDYINRGARKEWSPIALKGRVRVRASTNIGIYPSSKSGLTIDVNPDGTVSDAGAKGKYKVLQVVKQKEIWSGPEGVFRRRRLIQDHGYGVVEILVE